MSILSDLRDRLPGGATTAPAPKTDANGDAVAGSVSPVKNHDKVPIAKFNAKLSGYSQADLERIEEYERAHQNRGKIIDKLKWMRGPEPVAGYDAMSPEEVVTLLGTADAEDTRQIRSYEQKFGNRSPVMAAVNTARKRLKAAAPPEVVPAYRSGGGAKVPSRKG